MTKLFNKRKTDNVTDRRTYHIITTIDDDPYVDEAWNYYPKIRRGFKTSKKRILQYKVRMYKTWKHNRKTQYK